MADNPSEFERWFVRQFGPRPTDRTLWELNAERYTAEQKLRMVEELIAAVQRWEGARDAALYAWQAAQQGRLK